MFHRLAVKLISLFNGNLVHRFAYWSTRVFCFSRRLTRRQPHLPSRPVLALGLEFPNPVGLAAGFDRDGALARDLAHVGFGFVEIGTLNADSPAHSHSRPAPVIANLRELSARANDPSGNPIRQLIGISLGSKRNTLDDHTTADFLSGMDAVWEYADYLVINLSRPDSPGRSAGQVQNALRTLLETVKQRGADLSARHNTRVPIIIKVAVEHPWDKNVPVNVALAKEMDFDGVLTAFEYWPPGFAVVECVRWLVASIHPLPVIVVGGIRTANDVRRTLDAGAALVQLYSGLVDAGPSGVKRMLIEVSRLPDIP